MSLSGGGGSLFRGVSVQGDLYLVGSLCRGGSLFRGSLSGGRRVLCLGSLCPGGSLSGQSVSGGLCQGDPPRANSRCYASYWYAFLLNLIHA